MSRISVHDARRARAGFTLAEVMFSTGLLGIVLLGVLSSFVFVGRNLTRLVNTQQQEVESRRALRYFTQDLSAASQLSTASSTQLTMTKPAAVGSTSVTYTYSSGTGRLTRTQGATTATILTGLTSFTFTYYTESGNTVTGSVQSVKSVEMTYASAAGTAAIGTQSSYTTVSPRVVMRNKSALQ